MQPVPDCGSPAPVPAVPTGARRGAGTSSFIDLYAMQAWLIRDNEVVRGPVSICAGGPGYETPVGTFPVLWKEKLHVSVECAGRPMPFSIFFTTGGIAMHSGSLTAPSIGCIKMNRDDAEEWYAALEVGDEILVSGASKESERACRTGLRPRPTLAEKMLCGSIRRLDTFTENVTRRRAQRTAAQTGTGPR